eukprot:Nitzschia sp. Nitz4//scaffold21_size171442//9870//12079//NITZ4_002138-RA/size171442-augustus-gene-0.198-mRNA-1//-1//CDS//3329542342//7257//frame0
MLSSKAFLCLFLCLPVLGIHGAREGVHEVPTFTLDELRLGTRLHDLSMVLRTTGLLSVKVDTPHLQHDFHRSVAMDGLCRCLQDPFWDDSDHKSGSVEGVDTIILDDDFTQRTTVATATVGRDPLPLSSKETLEGVCGVDTVNSMDILRDHVAVVSEAFVESLDALNNGGSQYHFDASRDIPMLKDASGRSFSSLRSVVRAANHLEHFHYYKKQQETESQVDDDSITLQWHTDAGLFLAFVPAFDCPTSGMQKDGSFWLKLPNGEEVRAEFEDGTIAVMLGSGAEHWLETSLDLKATKHAVEMKGGDARTWYGTMHLVPENAYIQQSPPRTFGDMKANMKISGRARRTYGDGGDDHTVAIGCGSEYHVSSVLSSRLASSGVDGFDSTMRRRLQHVNDASYCDNTTNFFCWVQCLDIPNYELAEAYISEGMSLYCMDPAVYASSGNQVSKGVAECPDFVHNANCMGVWALTAPGYPGQEVLYNATIVDTDYYCRGGTSMYMDGFHWKDTTCVIYLFPSWILSTRGKFAAACIGTILLGIVVEYVIFRRRGAMRMLEAGTSRLVASSAFYGLQLTLGYIIMLVIMTYSIPLCMCVVLGFVSGHILFNAQDSLLSTKPQTIAIGANKGMAATTKLNGSSISDSGEKCHPSCCGAKMDPEASHSCCGAKEAEEAPHSCCGIKEVEEAPHSCCASKDKLPDNQGVPEGITPCCQNVL